MFSWCTKPGPGVHFLVWENHVWEKEPAPRHRAAGTAQKKHKRYCATKIVLLKSDRNDSKKEQLIYAHSQSDPRSYAYTFSWVSLFLQIFPTHVEQSSEREEQLDTFLFCSSDGKMCLVPEKTNQILLRSTTAITQDLHHLLPQTHPKNLVMVLRRHCFALQLHNPTLLPHFPRLNALIYKGKTN